nr:uncharacterized protein LOC111993632 [Quercus suber]
MTFTGLFCAAPVSHYVYNVKCARTLCELLFELFLLKEEERNSSSLAFWEDFTCLDVSQCTLNKAIVQVAVKYIETDISGCLLQFLSLGSKASIWCKKHLKMTLMSTEESQEEEHYNIFFQLLLDLLSFSAASFLALARYPVSDDKPLMDIVEKYILEQLDITKDSVSELKRIGSFGSEVVKVTRSLML